MGKKVELIREDDDLCLRASAGGTPELGYYLVYRGEKDAIITCLEAVLEALRSGRPVDDRRREHKT